MKNISRWDLIGFMFSVEERDEGRSERKKG